jgi:hypothetical protein
MKLSTFRQHLENLTSLQFSLPDGTPVPKHFHITEAGLSSKHFIDCGGTIRMEKNISFQLWVADDTDHRLAPRKLLTIIDIAAPLFGSEDLEIEVEYQLASITRFGLEFNENGFQFTTKETDCLAKDKCGIPYKSSNILIAEIPATQNACCTPGGECC